MLNYAFANANNLTSYITDVEFVFRGIWASGSNYTSPLDVVDFSTGKFICLISNSGTEPLGSDKWSEMALVGTVSPTDPFAIAQTAYDTAVAASALSLAAAGTATQALNLISAGTTAGSSVPIPNGTNIVYVAGLSLGYLPSSVVCTVGMPDLSGTNLWPTLVGQPTQNGFVVQLSGTTNASGYFLNWLARK